MIELADAVVVVVAAQVHQLGASLVLGGSGLLVLQSAKLGSDPIYVTPFMHFFAHQVTDSGP